MMHQTLKRALRLAEGGWRQGAAPVLIHTESGAVYELFGDGAVYGGSKRIRHGSLNGAVCRNGGPIWIGRVVAGLRMEIAVDGGGAIVTSRVVKLEEVLEQ